VVAGCAHTPDLPLRPDPTPPPGSTTETYIARDGTQLLARHWPATTQTRGVLVIMHGLKDHSDRYADLATRAAAMGFSVYAFDLRGHGRSAGPRVAPDRWTDYVDDLDRFLTKVQEREPNQPVFLFGHSMGGAIAARAAEVHRPPHGGAPIAGLILSGPALAIDAPPLLIAATRMTGALLPRVPALDLKNGDFSSDPAAKAAMDRDELISQPPAPARTAAGLIDGIEWIWTDIDQLTMPLLALHGTADRLTAPAGSRMLIDRAPAQDRTLRIYPGLFHDLIHEPKGAQVVTDILAWLDAHAGGPAVTPPPRYDGPLAGDPKGRAQAVELGAGVSHSVDGDHYRFAGDFTLALARPRPIGWHGLFTARWANSNYAVDLRPLGIAVRFGGAVLGVSGGASLVRGASGPQLGAAGGLWYEQPLGPAHVGIRADYEHAFASDARNAGWLLGTVRFGGDRSYWPHARAGVGPMFSAGYECAFADICSAVALAGFELYGAD
jgi:alpha-beta hydrolase superfamily lysophospholipase